MGSGTATSWADGWNKNEIQLGGKRSKMESIKAAAALGLGKAKAAVVVGGHKMKKRTSTISTINWIKTHCHRKTSK
ncbi:hypothetical protein IHE45_19G002800 [Dioscorea alata]|uniref:Uncharacterized protein n=1 Tax=Dioscorea alata TaxID=55571 RepID=A0ACB7TVU3_DIOAL|nr:hypothetical protein IHE45_19G002800 [Dioscorea alata]